MNAPALALRISSGAEVFLSLLPALVLTAFAIALNRFTLIDDGVILVQSHGATFLDNFRIGESGRVFPFYHLYHWILVRCLPSEAWVFSLGNGLFLLVAAAQVRWFARRIGGPGAGVAAVWLFTLNLSTVENLFTLGKSEPKQLVFWLACLALMGRALEGEPSRFRRIEAPLMFCFAAATVLFKETGVLLVVPLSVFTVLTLKAWRTLRASERRRRLILVVAALIPLAGSVGAVVVHGMRPGAYPRSVVIGGAVATTSWLPLLGRDIVVAVLLFAGLMAGLLLALRPASGDRLPTLLLVQFLAVVGFFTVIRAGMLYYYYPAVALAAVFVGGAMATIAVGGRTWKGAFVVLIALLLVYGTGRSVSGASALVAWSGLYDRLTDIVVKERPERVFFHQAGSLETHEEARLWWAVLNRMPVTVGVLDSPASDMMPQILPVTSRDLRDGDWIIEQFGTRRNARIPFRDVNVTRSIEHALIAPGGQALLRIRLLHEYEARFLAPSTGLTLLSFGTTSLQWRIYRVTETPRIILDGLDADSWMREQASLMIRTDGRARVTLRFFAYVSPSEGWSNQLAVYADGEPIARCPAERQGVSVCGFDVGPGSTRPGLDGWIVLELRALQTFSPLRAGLSRDSRNLSFDFGPTRRAGAAATLASSP